uniref:G-patch domain-containing protein n=1 Tax=Octactis speculum TaxID=3111310 RepID=A0A7S2DWI2_9STRA|mmetsp:Transcript_54590/g.74626  ORF Transcript_54590/g.74626 Transcript_54590/m.74626 type:complete len:211 (+) Transcript_54590:77-709(+)|eukprot:CAMPEP_0185748740 /NCGR_PEP_ID=MMETSP1174-20130828/7449_1 /TAXON_ID=35687 /ORGANISM="Dictyocha speculum, Strain CCMP1381" /LENGTH=210 /DNA_ID=CAMNT_0028424553 /DNA_START=152 /DNA_END=784 /DNA_ORIENTATION=+
MDLKLLSKSTVNLLGCKQNEGAASAVSDFALRQMEKMGWKKGMGLGKDENGIADHIRIEKKDGKDGLGMADQERSDEAKAAGWWNNGFANTLDKIQIGEKKKSKKRKRPSNSTEVPSFDELFAATGGARLGMRARRSQNGKIRRAEAVDTKDEGSKDTIEGSGKKKDERRKKMKGENSESSPKNRSSGDRKEKRAKKKERKAKKMKKREK